MSQPATCSLARRNELIGLISAQMGSVSSEPPAKARDDKHRSEMERTGAELGEIRNLVDKLNELLKAMM